MSTKAFTIRTMSDQDDIKQENTPDETPENNDNDGLAPPSTSGGALFASPSDVTLPELPESPDIDLSDSEAYALGEVESGFDIDDALASVSSLSDVIAEQEAQEAAEKRREEAQEQAIAEAEKRREAYYFERPPATTLDRGQTASIVPALALMVSGAGLTFAFTTADEPPQIGLVLLAMAGAAGISLLSYWLSTERWSRGALFGGLAILGTGAILLLLAQTDDPGAAGWPLLISGLGAAIALSGVLSPPVQGRQVMAGLVLVVAGLAGLSVTLDVLDTDMLDAIQDFGLVILAVIAVLVLIPGLLARRR